MKYIYIYIKYYILLLCLFRVPMIDIFKRFWVQHFFRVHIVIFITFWVHLVQIQKLTLNGN